MITDFSRSVAAAATIVALVFVSTAGFCTTPDSETRTTDTRHKPVIQTVPSDFPWLGPNPAPADRPAPGTDSRPVRGGEIGTPGHGALEFRAGFPSVDIRVHVPVNKRLEIIPYVNTNYLVPRYWMTHIGNNFGLELKIQVVRKGPFALSMSFDFGIVTFYRIPTDYGFRVGGGELVMSYRFDKAGIALIWGIRSYVETIITSNPGNYSAPMLFPMGIEFLINRHLAISLVGEPGFALGRGTYLAGTTGSLQLGVSFLW